MKQKIIHLIIFIVFIVFILSVFNGYSQNSNTVKKYFNNKLLGAGIEYVQNSEINIFGQLNFQNFALTGQVRSCSHYDKLYFYPGVKYYFNKSYYGIMPLVNVRYGKLHYDQKWSTTGYDYDVVYVWDAAMGQMVPEIRPSYSSKSGSSFINSPALSVSGGGEYHINDFAVNATAGMSYYTKIKGDFNNKNKFFFTIAALYYFGKTDKLKP